jgi:hypothetical protein
MAGYTKDAPAPVTSAAKALVLNAVAMAMQIIDVFSLFNTNFS